MTIRSGGEDRSRIPGIDMARGLAIIGMLAVHVGPTHLSDPAGRLYAGMVHGRASILFVLVAGIGVSLLASSRTTTLVEARWRLVWFAVVLLPLGLWLQSLDISILVIIPNYAILFLLGAAVLSAPNWGLLGLALVSGFFGPLGFLAGVMAEPGTFNRSAVNWTDGPADILHGLTLSGPYPIITWAAPFLVGMWLGRQRLQEMGLRLGLVAVGGVAAALAAIAAFWLEAWLGTPSPPADLYRLMDDSPHSQMPLWLIGSMGSALLVLGLSLILADVMGRLVWPLVAAGQLALTIYVGHILAFHWLGRALTTTDIGEALEIVLAITVIAAGSAMLWRAFLPRGPLELVLAAPWTLAKKLQRVTPKT